MNKVIKIIYDTVPQGTYAIYEKQSGQKAYTFRYGLVFEVIRNKFKLQLTSNAVMDNMIAELKGLGCTEIVVAKRENEFGMYGFIEERCSSGGMEYTVV